MAILRPDRYFKGVTDIDPRTDLADAGVTCVFLDLDNTLLPRDTHEVPSDVRAWLADLSTCGVSACILSNSWQDRAPEWAKRLGLPIVAKACKPLPFAYGRALRRMAAKRGECVCIGDQLTTDVWGAHLRGMRAFLVNPQCNVDPGHTVVVRKFERLVLGSMRPEQ